MKTQFLVLVILLTSFFFFSEMLIAQAPDTLWTRTFGSSMDGVLDENNDGATAVLQTSDGGYIVGGSFCYAKINKCPYLIYLDALGDTIRTKRYKSGFRFESIMPKMYELSDGFVMGSNKGGMIRTSLSLDTIWAKYYEVMMGGSDYIVHPTSFIRTSDSCYILTSYNR